MMNRIRMMSSISVEEAVTKNENWKLRNYEDILIHEVRSDF